MINSPSDQLVELQAESAPRTRKREILAVLLAYIGITLWFWWPMVGSLGYCHIRYREHREFSTAFTFALVFCWLIFVLFVSVILLVCSMPFIILLDELHKPLAAVSVIVPISWIIPACTAIVVMIAWWRRRMLESPIA